MSPSNHQNHLSYTWAAPCNNSDSSLSLTRKDSDNTNGLHITYAGANSGLPCSHGSFHYSLTLFDIHSFPYIPKYVSVEFIEWTASGGYQLSGRRLHLNLALFEASAWNHWACIIRKCVFEPSHIIYEVLSNDCEETLSSWICPALQINW